MTTGKTVRSADSSKNQYSNPIKMYDKRYSDGSYSGYRAKKTWRDYLVVSPIILLIAGWLLSLGAAANKRSGADLLTGRAYAAGFEQPSNLGDGKRIIDFSLEIAGFTASHAGTLSSAAESGQPELSFGTGPLNQIEDSGNENENHQWKLPDTTVGSTTVTGDGSGSGSSSYYQKRKVDDDQNHVVKLASEVSNNDFDWIKTLEVENGLWDMYRKHPNKNKDGSWDYACGLNSYYHKDMIARIKAKTVSEKEILEYCYGVYNQRHGAFYGYSKRNGYWSKKKWIDVPGRFYLVN